VTLLELFQLLRARWQLLVVLPVVFALGTAVYSWTLISNDYSSSVVLYVLTKTDQDTQSPSTVTGSDFSVSQQLANDISVLTRSNRVVGTTAQELGMSSLEGYKIDVTSATTNRVITLEVTGKDPQSVAVIADELAEQAAQAAVDIMDLRAVNIVDAAQVPTAPSGPNRPLFTLVAFIAGLVVAVVLIFLLDLLNTTVRSPEEAGELLELPVVGRMPRLK
jgi:capsular polysaccharide biosynthesis protein